MQASAPAHATAGRRPVGALIAILLVTVIWGWTFVWMKEATFTARELLGTSGTAAFLGLFNLLRFGLAAVVLPLILPAARRKLDANAWRFGFYLGVLLLAGFLLQMVGLQEVSAPVSAFLTSLYVLFTALLTVAIARSRPGWWLWLGVLLATFGAGFIDGPPQVSFGAGAWLTVAGAFAFAVHILAIDRYTKLASPLALTFTSFIFVALGSGVLLAGGMLGADSPEPRALLELIGRRGFLEPLLLSSLLATVLALSLMNFFQRQLSPVRAAILYALEPIWAALAAVAVGQDRVGFWLLVGGGSLLLGNLVAELGPYLARRRALRRVPLS